ncbi:MAG: hypothetical protein FD144_4751 [Rhodospirillaceae bacterium]|nr:MAG: hypothetical protein FD144_4751 [Rhodospirillaceae bacterium]
MIDLPTVTLAGAMASIGMVAGAAAFLLGVAQLTCEHGGSSWLPRLTTVMLSMTAAYTAVDSWDFWSGVDDTLDAKAVAFCIALALSWGYRRTFGFTSQSRHRPPA